jgi:hypothetical protein
MRAIEREESIKRKRQRERERKKFASLTSVLHKENIWLCTQLHQLQIRPSRIILSEVNLAGLLDKQTPSAVPTTFP